jgi:hypothetical protein
MTTETSTSERLIPEDEIRAQITGEWAGWRSDQDVLDIAEARLLLGLPADTDTVSGEMLLRLVRRVVVLEQEMARRSTRG